MRFKTDAEVTNEIETFYRKESVQFFWQRQIQTCAAMGQMYVTVITSKSTESSLIFI